ncbi:hypothetical protein BaRGS_00006170 [Batillaria attramentaria]|uniref:Uncharacterized protein n=1 Tax=Batillaria attramentaria TaxID=370345 RepID=A0ABD0LSN8_9CAEN
MAVFIVSTHAPLVREINFASPNRTRQKLKLAKPKRSIGLSLVADAVLWPWRRDNETQPVSGCICQHTHTGQDRRQSSTSFHGDERKCLLHVLAAGVTLQVKEEIFDRK